MTLTCITRPPGQMTARLALKTLLWRTDCWLHYTITLTLRTISIIFWQFSFLKLPDIYRCRYRSINTYQKLKANNYTVRMAYVYMSSTIIACWFFKLPSPRTSLLLPSSNNGGGTLYAQNSYTHDHTLLTLTWPLPIILRRAFSSFNRWFSFFSSSCLIKISEPSLRRDSCRFSILASSSFSLLFSAWSSELLGVCAAWACACCRRDARTSCSICHRSYLYSRLSFVNLVGCECWLWDSSIGVVILITRSSSRVGCVCSWILYTRSSWFLRLSWSRSDVFV